MTAATLGERGGARRSAPRAIVDHCVLAANARALVGASAAPVAADLRRDAWGHGLIEVWRTLRASGIDAFVVDDDARAALGIAGADAGTLRRRGDTAEAPAAADLYGLPGGAGTPVLRLHGSVLSVKPLRVGEGVSYGYLHRAAVDTRIALVAGGYAQGVVRSLGGAVGVRIGGERRPIVGRIAMDVCVVDLGETAAARGDEVVFFGDQGAGHPPLADWTEATGLTAAEIVTTVGLRAQREHVS
ncbi:alanine racemase C-terminal domain-containing protein [Microbacterium fluvii]|uniref:Alanine racemase C-terminal domain-containing protein n=1 Tax=Microbacterium fluvii TaxID=415215 RepID=A0ABW2HBV6_9MICO|nr:alanine racemase C-terminal domain-containing protein [Microbacterium fluvii]MCU4671962.1 alanine racemase [Microbacterium fluvii]